MQLPGPQPPCADSPARALFRCVPFLLEVPSPTSGSGVDWILVLDLRTCLFTAPYLVRSVFPEALSLFVFNMGKAGMPALESKGPVVWFSAGGAGQK